MFPNDTNAKLNKWLNGSQEPTIYNVTMTNANTEYSQLIPDGAKKITANVQLGSPSDNIRFSWITGKVATPTSPYEQYPADIQVSDDNLNLIGKTLYFACSSAGKVMQITIWK